MFPELTLLSLSPAGETPPKAKVEHPIAVRVKGFILLMGPWHRRRSCGVLPRLLPAEVSSVVSSQIMSVIMQDPIRDPKEPRVPCDTCKEKGKECKSTSHRGSVRRCDACKKLKQHCSFVKDRAKFTRSNRRKRWPKDKAKDSQHPEAKIIHYQPVKGPTGRDRDPLSTASGLTKESPGRVDLARFL